MYCKAALIKVLMEVVVRGQPSCHTKAVPEHNDGLKSNLQQACLFG